MSAETPFADLVARLRQGDGTAAEELVKRYEGHIRRVVRERLSNSQLQSQFDSTDVCQSVLGNFFVRAALGEFDLDSPQQLAGLLATMARNRFLNRVEQANAQKRGGT